MAYYIKQRFLKDDFCMTIDQDKTIYINYKNGVYKEVFEDKDWNSQLLFTLTDDNFGSNEDVYIDNRELFLSLKTCYLSRNIKFEESYEKGSCGITFILCGRQCRIILFNSIIIKKNEDLELYKFRIKEMEDKVLKLTKIIKDNNLEYLI